MGKKAMPKIIVEEMHISFRFCETLVFVVLLEGSAVALMSGSKVLLKRTTNIIQQTSLKVFFSLHMLIFDNPTVVL